MKADQSPAELHRGTLWLLRLVPPYAHARWWCAAGIFLVLVLLFYLTGVFGYTEADSSAWPAALFFCAILSYITPIFHYVTRRTEQAFDELTPQLSADAETLRRWRAGISCKSARWVVRTTVLGVGLWLLQSWLLTGGFVGILQALTSNSESLVMALAPLPVWLFMTCALNALIDNARLFRVLSSRIRVDLLDTSTLNPFGRMAVASTLVVIGAQALFPIMWLGASTDPWTTIPGLLLTGLPLAYLFAAPTWPVHRALHNAKKHELQRLRTQIRQLRQGNPDATADPTLCALLIYRREIVEAPEWPFDISIVARLGLYLVIVPLTWIGAALIENVVDLFISA